MVRLIAGGTFFCLLASLALGLDEKPRLRPIETADSVLAIYPEDWGLGSPTRVNAAILVVWSDGHAIWSNDRLHGGAPYHTGRVGPEKVVKLLKRFEDDGLFSDKHLNDSHFGPDSKCT